MKTIIIKFILEVNKMKNYEVPKLKLTIENVEKIFLDCFLPVIYTDDTKVILVNAVTGNFGFDP